MPNQHRAGYQAWYQRLRQRALTVLRSRHPEEFDTILADLKAAEPFDDKA